MQNLALTSQFGNNGRRGNSSSNSFNSIVLNGVLPPSEDGRVEAIQVPNPMGKKKWVYRDDSPLEPGGWMEKDLDPWDIDYDGGSDTGTGTGTGTGTSSGKGFVPGSSSGWIADNSGFIIPNPNLGDYYGPETWSEQQRKRREADTNHINKLSDYFDVGGKYTGLIVSIAVNQLIKNLTDLGASVNDVNTSRSFDLIKKTLEELINYAIDSILIEFSDFIRNPNRKDGATFNKTLAFDSDFYPFSISDINGNKTMIDTIRYDIEIKYNNGILYCIIYALFISRGKIVSYSRIAQFVIE
jgi:hypothetical protein